MCRGGNGQDGNGQGWEWAGVVMDRMVMGRGGNGQGWEWAGVGMGRGGNGQELGGADRGDMDIESAHKYWKTS